MLSLSSLQTFPLKNKEGKSFGFVAYSLGLHHSYSLYHCIAKAAIDNTVMSACSCVPIRLYL